MKTGLAALIALTFATAAQAQTTRGNLPACITEAKLSEAFQAINARDQRWFDSIGGCIITKAGLSIRVVDRGWVRSRVRIFTPDGASLTMWTPSENIRD